MRRAGLPAPDEDVRRFLTPRVGGIGEAAMGEHPQIRREAARTVHGEMILHASSEPIAMVSQAVGMCLAPRLPEDPHRLDGRCAEHDDPAGHRAAGAVGPHDLDAGRGTRVRRDEDSLDGGVGEKLGAVPYRLVQQARHRSAVEGGGSGTRGLQRRITAAHALENRVDPWRGGRGRHEGTVGDRLQAAGIARHAELPLDPRVEGGELRMTERPVLPVVDARMRHELAIRHPQAGTRPEN